jgi:hypothetical protein
MAKVKYSALLEEMRGKLNGSVASKNRYGFYWRNKTVPVNPQTNFQSLQRGNLTGLSQAWKTLTQAQRDDWQQFSNNHPFNNIFGDSVTLSGNAMYVKVNSYRFNMGAAALNDSVEPVSTFKWLSASITANDATGAIEITINPSTPLGTSLFIYATPPESAGREFGSVKNDLRLIGVKASPAGPVFQIGGTYTNRFGSVAGKAGKKVFFRLLPVDEASGYPMGVYSVVAVIA